MTFAGKPKIISVRQTPVREREFPTAEEYEFLETYAGLDARTGMGMRVRISEKFDEKTSGKIGAQATKPNGILQRLKNIFGFK